uniref:Uncharacterized protein n=1 Tax=Oryza meridionalis TaxID=40149 RepID=A0A0E0F4F0_9ORYZ
MVAEMGFEGLLHMPLITNHREELQAPNVEVVSHVKRLIAERMKVASFKDVNKEVLEDVLDKHHRGQMSKAEKESFKTAFLIYFSALLDPNEIAKFNWSGYVLNEILDAAAAVQKKHADGTKCGEELQAPNVEVVSHVKRLIAERMKAASFKDVNMEELEDVLDKHHRGQMSKAEKESFKTAFLMFVIYDEISCATIKYGQ